MDKNEPVKKHEWKKGQSGNPNGRPKDAPNKRKIILDILKLEQTVVHPVTQIELSLNMMQMVALAMLKKALRGDVKCATWLIENGYGKELERIQFNTDAPQVDVRTMFNFRDDTPKI